LQISKPGNVQLMQRNRTDTEHFIFKFQMTTTGSKQLVYFRTFWNFLPHKSIWADSTYVLQYSPFPLRNF